MKSSRNLVPLLRTALAGVNGLRPGLIQVGLDMDLPHSPPIGSPPTVRPLVIDTVGGKAVLERADWIEGGMAGICRDDQQAVEVQATMAKLQKHLKSIAVLSPRDMATGRRLLGRMATVMMVQVIMTVAESFVMLVRARGRGGRQTLDTPDLWDVAPGGR